MSDSEEDPFGFSKVKHVKIEFSEQRSVNNAGINSHVIIEQYSQVPHDDFTIFEDPARVENECGNVDVEELPLVKPLQPLTKPALLKRMSRVKQDYGTGNEKKSHKGHKRVNSNTSSKTRIKAEPIRPTNTETKNKFEDIDKFVLEEELLSSE